MNSTKKQPTTIFGVCPGIVIRPSGRFVRKSIAEGFVSFWVLHVEASITCPRNSRDITQFTLNVDHWNEPIAWSQNTFSQLDDEGRTIPGSYNSNPTHSMQLHCSSPAPTYRTISGYVRRVRLSWLYDNSTTSANQPDIEVFIRITSRMLFEGNFTQERKRVLCEFFSGFWCDSVNSTSVPNEQSVCVQATMRCDGLPDCNPQIGRHEPVNRSQDEMNCDRFWGNYTLETENRWAGPYNTTFMERWTARLPWLILAPIPFVLICALIRICSQKRQLDLSEQADFFKGDQASEQLNPSIKTPRKFMQRRRINWRRTNFNPVVSLPRLEEVDETGLENAQQSDNFLNDPLSQTELQVSVIEEPGRINRYHSMPCVHFIPDREQICVREKPRASRLRRYYMCWSAFVDTPSLSSSSLSSACSSTPSCSQCDLFSNTMRRIRSCEELSKWEQQGGETMEWSRLMHFRSNPELIQQTVDGVISDHLQNTELIEMKNLNQSHSENAPSKEPSSHVVDLMVDQASGSSEWAVTVHRPADDQGGASDS